MSSRKSHERNTEALLAGKLFDDRGNKMTPSHTRKSGQKYRYYISSVLNQGAPEQAGRIRRVSAEEVEALVAKAVRDRFKLSDESDGKELIGTTVTRVDIRMDRLIVLLSKANSEGHRNSGRPPKHLETPWQKTAPTRRREILLPEGAKAEPPRPIRSETRTLLVISIARGRRWLNELMTNKVMSVDKIAKRERCSPRKINMTISLAFLAPTLIKAAIDGRLPDGLGVTHLCDLPAILADQYRTLGLSLPAPLATGSNRVSR